MCVCALKAEEEEEGGVKFEGEQIIVYYIYDLKAKNKNKMERNCHHQNQRSLFIIYY